MPLDADRSGKLEDICFTFFCEIPAFSTYDRFSSESFVDELFHYPDAPEVAIRLWCVAMSFSVRKSVPELEVLDLGREGC